MATSDGATTTTLLTRLEGRTCTFCGEGELEIGQFRGNDAALCNRCGTPRAQLW